MIPKLNISPLIVLIVVLAVITSVLFIVKITKNNSFELPFFSLQKCTYEDQTICKMLSKTKANFQNGFKATLIKTIDGQETKDIWLKKDDTQQFSQLNNSQETYDIILIKNIFYVKDGKNNQWWKQETPQKNNLEKLMPYELNNAEKVQSYWKGVGLTVPNTQFKQIGKEPCLVEICYKYQIIRSEVSDMTELLFINPDFSLHKVRHEYPDGTTRELIYEMIKDYPKAPEEIKKTSPSQNIFAHIQPIREEKKDLDYLKDFENNMNDGSTKEIQIKPSESKTLEIKVEGE